VSSSAPDFRLDGKTVVVVGASRGIGAASAIACAASGAEQVVLLGRDEVALADVAREVSAVGGRAEVTPCDVTESASIDVAFASIERVDVMVQCAGTNQPEPFVEVAEETFDRLFALNVRGAFLAIQAAVRKMEAAGRGGCIISISSQMGHVGAPNRSVYCATKHALEGLTKALAVELADRGIRVVSIAPTFVRTAMTSSQLEDPEIGPALLARIPQGRFGTPEEVAGAVVYAASPTASLLTGSSILLDGGWTAQ
jgi:NAD(P)-dependent dehydrogenase (short-subunit alcohol dehydrogenase family)